MEERQRPTLFERVSKGMAWTFVGNVVWRASRALSTIVVARILGPVGFGEFGMVKSTADMFSVYAGFRMGATATKYVAEFRDSDPRKAARILKLSLLFSLVTCLLASAALLFSAPYFANHTLNNSDLVVPLAIGAVLVFFLVYGNVQEFAIAGFENFKAIAKVSAVRGLVGPLISIPCAYYWGINGAMLGLLVVAILAMILLSVTLRRERRSSGLPNDVSIRDLKQELPVIWKFALPGLLIGIMLSLCAWLGRAFLVQGEAGYSELGLFEAANQWRNLVLFLPAVLTRVMLPILSETYASEKEGEFDSAITISFQSACLTTLPLVVLTIGLSVPLSLFYGSEFSGTEKMIPVLAISVFLFALNQALRQVYDGSGKRWTNFAMYLTWAITFVLVGATQIPEHGAMGLAYSYLFAELILLVTQYVAIDMVLAPGILRRQIPLLGYSVFLLSCTFYLAGDIEKPWNTSLVVLMFIMSAAPALMRAKRVITRWL